MPRFCANLSMMFNEHPFLDRFAAASKAGFTAVEFLFPYDHTPAEIRARLDDNGLEQILFNMPPGDWAAGERGTASLVGRTVEFRDGVKKALEYAAVFGTKRLHCMAGMLPAGVAYDTAASLYAANLAWACELARQAGVLVVIEPINHRDMPGFFLNTTGQGAAVVEAIGRDRLALLFDIYHCQITEGDVTSRMAKLLPLIGHIQIADVPARNEPGTGEINWKFVFQRMDAIGYDGWVGCEYRPAGDTIAGLTWIKNVND
ncbi:2-oxo-tetronate isomerase [Acidisphaera sp. L21]|uniref:2-oxo-tetronate isomerase n=1 Tax=Acidisphaera sp. L21 TaxID=1641851 RepID=UPI00131CBC02|nr:2-oxo-tetronate isomerase [Acidisphaera sp. L21]